MNAMNAMNPFGDVVKVFTGATVLLPRDVVTILLDIQRSLVDPGVEFGIYLKGELDKDTMTFTVKSGEYFLPKQNVTTVTIDFVEGRSFVPDFNTVIHRHPEGCNNFSSVDEHSINKNWDVSILFIPPNRFPAAIINIDITDTTRIQLPARVKIIPAEADKEFEAMVQSKIPLRRNTTRQCSTATEEVTPPATLKKRTIFQGEKERTPNGA
jgi:hypothetical protein